MSTMWKDTIFLQKQSIRFGGKLFAIEQPMIMGILNLTPDSFFDGGKYKNEKQILQRVGAMLKEGADIIDIGAYSSRPGAKDISQKTELERLKKIVPVIVKEFPGAILSIDTFRSEVASWGVEHGISMINDISGGTLDKKMFETVAGLGVPYVLMHMKGSPQTMNDLVNYKDIANEILYYFSDRISEARKSGIHDIIIDPGFGFAKDLEGNYQLMKSLDRFHMFQLPLLVGISRKSMVNKVIDVKSEGALYGTVALNTIALISGACLLRVHDVKAAVDARGIVSYWQNA